MPNLPETDVLAAIPLDARHVLEVGCVGGELAQAFRARQPKAVWFGIGNESGAALDPEAFMDRFIHGDIEDTHALEALDEARGGQRFDAIVVAHASALRNPVRTMAALRQRVAPGGVCIIGVDNGSHWSLLPPQLKDGSLSPELARRRLLAGDAAIALIGRTGWTLLEARPQLRGPEETEAALSDLAPLAESLGIDRGRLRRNVAPHRWIFRALEGPAPPQLHIVGLGLAKVAGVTEARIDYPLSALNSLPRVRAVWDSGGIRVPPGFDPGILIVHRQKMNEPALAAKAEELIGKGWAIVYEIDDDPSGWQSFLDDGFHDLRSVHAVTVSTPRLARTIERWNPNVAIFPNAIHQLPEASVGRDGPIRIFFGALNRWHDWRKISGSLIAASLTLAERIDYIVVHDRQVFDSLPDALRKEFHPTLPPDRYMELLGSCDIALLPLDDNDFNRCKSDLKFIECCAAGVVPICSPVVYAERPEHRDIGIIVDSPERWGTALRSLCENPETLARRREAGLAYVKAHRMHSQQLSARESFYRGLLANRDTLEAERRQRLR